MQFILSQDQFTLITLLIQLGVIAAISTIFVRFDTFKRMLFNETLGLKRRFYLTTLLGLVFAAGVLARLFLNYKATDLTLPATLIAGIIAGPYAGVGVGVFVGLPALFFHEYLALPFAMIFGFAGGLIFLKEPSLEKRMDFSPFTIIKTPNFMAGIFKNKEFPVQLQILVLCILFGILSIWASRHSDGRLLFNLNSSNYIVNICIILGIIACVGIPLKIWNNTRVELLLFEKEKKLVEAKLEAIKSKIQPHFLFNTLNTIFSSIRVDPDKARSVVLRLSEVLRSVLNSKSEFCRLSEEINLIESYLSIEEARFGKGKVEFTKDVGEGTSNLFIPAMILQPIVENSIKHGISKNIDSGKIELSAKKDDKFLEIELKDNGAGIPRSKIENVKRNGIGLSSVEERLKVLFGKDFEFNIQSVENEGTRVSIKMPVLNEVREI